MHYHVSYTQATKRSKLREIERNGPGPEVLGAASGSGPGPGLSYITAWDGTCLGSSSGPA